MFSGKKNHFLYKSCCFTVFSICMGIYIIVTNYSLIS